MTAKGILPPTLKMILKKYYPLPVHPLPVSPHPEIPSCSSPLPCTEPESSGGDQTKNDHVGAPSDEPEEERSEIPLAVYLDDMTGKHRDLEQIPLEKAPFLGGEGKVVPQRASPALKKGLKGPEKLHIDMQQTAVDGFSQADCTRSTD